jgi:hypothetical protein
MFSKVKTSLYNLLFCKKLDGDGRNIAYLIILACMIFIFTLIWALTASAQNQFEMILGGVNNDWGNSVVQTSDGGFLVAGVTCSFDSANQDMFVSKFDPYGRRIWTKTIGGPREDECNTVIETSDGGFVLSGTTKSFGAGDEDWLLVKFDSSGNNVWTKIIGGSLEDGWGRMIESSDGSEVIVGWTGANLLLAKLDSSGNYLWAKTLSVPDGCHGYSVTEASDGGLVVTGFKTLYVTDGEDILLAKFDASGNHLWTKILGGQRNDHPYFVIEVSDSGLVVTGWTESFDASSTDLFLTKLDASGNHLWTRRLNLTGNDIGTSIIEVDDGLVVTGYAKAFEPDSAVLLLTKFDTSGNHLWTRILGEASWDQGNAVIEASDGKLAVTGYTNSFGVSKKDLLFAMFDVSGNNCLGEFVTPEIHTVIPDTLTVSPNVSPWTPSDTGSPQLTIRNVDPTITVVCQTPSCFPLITPSVSDSVKTPVTFIWYKSINLESTDTIRYDLYVSRFSNFNPTLSYSNLVDTCFTDISGIISTKLWYWKVKAHDIYGFEGWSCDTTWSFYAYLCGDCNGDGVIDVGDVVWEINYLFKNGPPPKPYLAGDVNCDGIEDVGDVVYKINYLFKNGQSPCAGCP